MKCARLVALEMNAQYTLFFIFAIIKCDEDLDIKIGLPEYICDKDGVREISKDMTTIRLSGRDVQDVNFLFDVKFKIIGKKCPTQRCTLILWQTVRELDRYLKNYPKTKLQSGIIEINNTMFNPGLQYMVNVKFQKNGKTTEEKLLTLSYIDAKSKENIEKPIASLFLFAPNYAYAYSNYVVNAEANICSNISSFHFNWELIKSSENSTTFPTKSDELVIPPETLKALESYKIKCSLIGEDGLAVVEKQQTVNVLSKGLKVLLPIKHLTTRSDQEVKIKSYIKDLDNIDGEMRFSWSCFMISTNTKCEYGEETNELELSPFEVGTYNISLEVSKSEFSESDFCTLQVLENAPLIDIEDFEIPQSTSEEIKISTTIYELATFCSLQWTSPKIEGYASLDLNSVPGNINKILNITTKEDLFLNELEEFTNDTFDSNHDLVIPKPNKSWNGLQGDVKYLFRLMITCPEIDEVLSEFNGTQTFKTDVVIETNSPPKIGELEISPLEGEAFATNFEFKTSKAEDKDGPILYKFGYKLEEEEIVFMSLQDVVTCESNLPYSEEKIQTFLEICDNFGACKKTSGPNITTKLPANINIKKILERFKTKMFREDYHKAFDEAFAISHSLKSDEMNAVIDQKILEEVEKYLKIKEDLTTKEKATNLMMKINEFNSKLNLSEAVLNKVVDLRNKLSGQLEAYTKRKLLSLRSKRASSLSLRDVKNYLEISELIITTSSDPIKINLEKENLRKQLHNYMEKLCGNIKKNQLVLELKTVIFSLEKMKRNSLNNFISVPFEGNSWQTFARIKLGNVVKDSKEKCIGKLIFKDYLGKKGFAYFVDILNSSEVNESTEIVIFLPKNISIQREPKCLVYYDNNWKSECKKLQNVANFVKCSCKHLGYYYLDYIEDVNEKPTTIQVTTSNPVTEKISNESLKITKEDNKNNYDTISYTVIAISVIGIIILGVSLRRIFHDDDDEDEESETFDFPKYAQLHNEEFLNDAHI